MLSVAWPWDVLGAIAPPPPFCQDGARSFFKIDERWLININMIDQRQYDWSTSILLININMIDHFIICVSVKMQKGAGVLNVCLNHWSLFCPSSAVTFLLEGVTVTKITSLGHAVACNCSTRQCNHLVIRKYHSVHFITRVINFSILRSFYCLIDWLMRAHIFYRNMETTQIMSYSTWSTRSI